MTAPMNDAPAVGDPITFLKGNVPHVTRVVGDDHLFECNSYALCTVAGSWWLHEEGIVWARGPATPETVAALRAAQALVKKPVTARHA